LDLDDEDDNPWLLVDADGSARPFSDAPPAEGRSSHHAVAPPDGLALDSPDGDHVAPPAPRRRQARNPRPPVSKPKRQTSSKWLSVPIPAKYGGPTIYVRMTEALALTKWFNEDLKNAIFEYADAKSAGPPFQLVKARMKLAGWQIAKRKPRNVNKFKKHIFAFDSAVKKIP
jgi:hypothetical protein